MTSREKRVLLVDDAPESRAMYELFLTAAGYAVEQASNGAEALARSKSWRPDVVVLDLGMPSMNGFEAARKMRNDAELHDIPIIILTGYDTFAVYDEARALAVDAVLVKPCLPKALAARVDRILAVNPHK